MIVLFTDFGLSGPYTGQMKAVLHERAPDEVVVDLMADAPAFDPRASAYLLAALATAFPKDTVFVCVVDPGVGGARRALVLETDGQRFVGPDNGLLAIAARRAESVRWREVVWKPSALSASFHGRDLFAPVAAMLARGDTPVVRTLSPGDIIGAGWPDDLAEVVYIDIYGNAITGWRAAGLSETSQVFCNGQALPHARTFSQRPPGQAFWYENANGLVEIACNQASAAAAFGLAIGSPVEIVP